MQSQESTEKWDSYVASYEDDLPGSTTLRMDLIGHVPIPEFEIVVVAGLGYKSLREDRFPDSEETFSLLHRVADDLMVIINRSTEAIQAGSFMHNSERLEYIYVRDSAGLKKSISDYFEREHPTKEYYLNVTEDPTWKYYREFLFPNKETQRYMSDQAVVQNLIDNGDDLSIARRVDHWIYFKNSLELSDFKNEIVGRGFQIESSESIEEDDEFKYALVISRVDHVTIDAIYPVTSELTELSEENNGYYDGWETTVEKE